MDVRCERCRAQYVFDDEQVTPQGLTVQCTNCGHVFRVKKKELVVTVPVRPEDVTEQPMLASAAALRPSTPGTGADPRTPRPAAVTAPPVEAPQQGWTIRQAGGGTLTFTELTTLQKWIVERKVGRDDEVSQGDDAWVRLGTIGELYSFFEVVDAAERGRRTPPAARPGGTDFYPPPPFPPSGFASPASKPAPPVATPAAAPPRLERSAPPPAARATLTAELDPEELAAVGGRKTGRTRLAVITLLLVTVGAAAYVFGPALLGRDVPAPAAPAAPAPPAPARPAPEPVAVPLNIELKPEPPAEPARPAPATSAPEEKLAAAKAPEPAADPPQPKAADKAAEPVAAPAAKPAGPKAQLAQARKLREAGENARALDLYGKVLAAQPDNVDAQTGRGLCYFELGQYAPAEASFKRALQLDLEHPDAIMGLAETYRQQGKKTEALAQFERYLAIHPDGEEAAVARYAISQLKE
jgi:predicted Zn finger-like uncharacterized protein